ncbi:hypothetical protein, partial [uncultured Pseudomonas sp.]|uniref:hypothetical protein n=1 Tax=uncultured Pseudomonas sp. TaxID=114707 RepID=UPI002805D506
NGGTLFNAEFGIRHRAAPYRKGQVLHSVFAAASYYDFEPSHSIFLAGSVCLVGPIFKNISSKETPAIAFDKDGLFIKPYLSYISETLKSASDRYE